MNELELVLHPPSLASWILIGAILATTLPMWYYIIREMRKEQKRLKQ